MNTTQFVYLVQTAKAKLADHKTCKTPSSLKLASYAVGLAVGYFMGAGTPNDWRAEIDILQTKAELAGVL